MSFHNKVSFSRKAAVEAVKMESGHSQLTVGVRLTTGVKSREDFEVLELDTLWNN